jgi:hypothetical protein
MRKTSPLLPPLIVAGALCCASDGAMQTPTAPQTDRGLVLADSAIAYHASGGLAGRRHEATLTAKDGRVAVEFLPEHSTARATPLSGALTPDEYLSIWRKAEQLGVWELAVPATQATGADFIDRALRIRLGTRVHSVTWNELTANSPPALTAAQLANRVVAAARTAAGVR